MRILAARIVDLVDYANEPHVELLVDAIPARSDLVYQTVERADGATLYFAEHGGYVSFLAHVPTDEHGFGGARFELPLADGTTRTVTGPWSSRPSVMNAAGFTPSVDVSITADPAAWERGYTFSTGHVTRELLLSYGPMPYIERSWRRMQRTERQRPGSQMPPVLA